MPGPLAAALITAGGGVLANVFSAREAAKNRAFQERMSSTAHQREMRDLKAAGINPALRGLSGSSTPAGDSAEIRDSAGSAVQAALAVKKQKAEIDLIQANAALAKTQAGDIASSAQGRYSLTQAQNDLANANSEQLRAMLPLLLERAKAEARSMLSSARAHDAVAALDEASRAGAENLEQLEKRLGEGGAWMRLFMQFLRRGGR